ncbi:hypothetical protein AGMMS50239_13280 [Bacteroidia bacterium]|nr:hypothetical protein AGMMS50239_13280 [Bacteroidia bacterium]
MKRKIIEGESVSIDEFKNYRDSKSDASFGIKGQPNSMMLKELMSGKSIEEYSSFELNTRQGYPNDSLTVKLIDGSTEFDIHKSVKDKHRKIGPLESILFSLNVPTPGSHYDSRRLMRTEPLEEMNNDRLIQIAFSPFSFSKYGKEIKEHFSLTNKQAGTDLRLKIDKWYNSDTNKDLVVDFIKDKLKEAYTSKKGIMQEIIVPKDLLKKLTFRTSIKNMSEMIAIGGIQYVNLKGYLLDVKWGGKSWNSQGKIIESSTIIQVQLDFVLGDWFGVDEDDITNNGIAAQLGRKELAALWILQHQRGYHPFICFYEYSEILNLKL